MLTYLDNNCTKIYFGLVLSVTIVHLQGIYNICPLRCSMVPPKESSIAPHNEGPTPTKPHPTHPPPVSAGCPTPTRW